MKYIISLVVILAVAIGCTDDFDSVNISTITIGEGNFEYSETEEGSEYLLVSNSIHWNQLRQGAETGSITDSIIDFGQYTIIACLDSVRPSSGYDIKIESVVEEEDEVVVTVKKTSAPSGLTVVTRPFHFVKVPKIDKPVEFK